MVFNKGRLFGRSHLTETNSNSSYHWWFLTAKQLIWTMGFKWVIECNGRMESNEVTCPVMPVMRATLGLATSFIFAIVLVNESMNRSTLRWTGRYNDPAQLFVQNELTTSFMPCDVAVDVTLLLHRYSTTRLLASSSSSPPLPLSWFILYTFRFLIMRTSSDHSCL